MIRRMPMLTAALAFLTATPVNAQTLRGTIVIEGSTLQMPPATVSVLNAAGDSVVMSRVSEAGRFLFDLPDAGSFRLRVEALGFRTLVTAPVAVGVSTSVTLELRLRENAIALEPLQVVAERIEPPFMRDIRERQKMGFGKLLTREDLDNRFGSKLEDVLRNAGMWIEYIRLEGGRQAPLVTGRPSAARVVSGAPCYSAVYLNGVRHFPTAMFATGAESVGADGKPVLDGVALERMWEIFQFRPQDVEAVELYRSRGETPAEWASPTADCGVVAVWLRSGYEKLAEPAYTGPMPVIAFSAWAAGYRLEGDRAPGAGVGVAAAATWRIRDRVSAALWLTRTAHQMTGETTAALMVGRRPGIYDMQPGERSLAIWSLTLEPRYELLPQARVTPVAGVRLQLARRSFSVQRPFTADRVNDFSSFGAGAGLSLGLAVRVTQRVAFTATAAQDRVFFASYPYDPPRNETSSTWNATTVQLGVTVRP